MHDTRRLYLSSGEKYLAYTVKLFGSQINPPVMLLNTWGMTGFVVEKLAQAMADKFHVIVWEEHYVHGTDEVVSSAQLDISFRISVVKQIMDQLEIPNSAPFVTWCAGAYTIVELILSGVCNPGKVVMISPSDLSGGDYRTDYQVKFLPMLASAHQANETRCEIIRKALSGTIGKLAKMEPGRDEAISEASAYYTRDLMKFRNYSACVQKILQYREGFPERFRSAFQSRSIHIVQGLDDAYIDYHDSLGAIAEIPSAALSLLSSGGHFLPATRTGKVAGLVEAAFLEEGAPC